MDELPLLQVSQAVDVINQALYLSVPQLSVEGEVSGYRLSQGRWVFFDIKDDTASLKCFLPLNDLGLTLEDGMKVIVTTRPNLHKKYGFSLVVDQIKPSGEGSLKRALELSRRKLAAEGLFDLERKRELPRFPERIGLITSSEAAAFTDIIKILEGRWPLAQVVHADSAVQGDKATGELITALRRLNEHSPSVELIIISRGGGSLEDLMAFNDEKLVRAISASRAPTIVGVGHERDETLSELAADIRATTPTNAAQLAAPEALIVGERLTSARTLMLRAAKSRLDEMTALTEGAISRLAVVIEKTSDTLRGAISRLELLNPASVLKRGYALVHDDQGRLVRGSAGLSRGDILKTRLSQGEFTSEVKDVNQ